MRKELACLTPALTTCKADHLLIFFVKPLTIENAGATLHLGPPDSTPCITLGGMRIARFMEAKHMGCREFLDNSAKQ